jgi:hypothetical protein
VIRPALVLIAGLLVAPAAQAGFDQAEWAFKTANWPKMVEEARPEAQAGHPGAQYLMALAYEKGLGVAANEAESVRWLKLAAGQGHRNAIGRLGMRYADGQGVARSASEGRKLLQQAADNDDTIAMNRLGRMILAGDGGAAEPAKGYAWIALAARRTRPESPQKLAFAQDRDQAAAKLSAKQLEQGEALVEAWTEKYKIKRSREINAMRPYHGPTAR